MLSTQIRQPNEWGLNFPRGIILNYKNNMGLLVSVCFSRCLLKSIQSSNQFLDWQKCRLHWLNFIGKWICLENMIKKIGGYKTSFVESSTFEIHDYRAFFPCIIRFRACPEPTGFQLFSRWSSVPYIRDLSRPMFIIVSRIGGGE